MEVRILTMTDGEVRLVIHRLRQGRLFAAAVLLFRKLASLHVFGSWRSELDSFESWSIGSEFKIGLSQLQSFLLCFLRYLM